MNSMHDKKSRRQLFEEALLEQEIANFIQEVTIAGEVPTDNLYAKYRPEDPMQYIGMKPKSHDDGAGEGAQGEDVGGDSLGAGGLGGEHLDKPITFDDTSDDAEALAQGTEISSATTNVHERMYYTMMHRNSKFNP